MIDLFTKGINQFYVEEDETIYYYTDSLRAKNCVITLESTYLNDGIQDLLTVDILVSGDAHSFVMFWDTPLPSLVTRRMIKDIVVFIKYNPVPVIIDFLGEMSEQHISSKMQSIEAHSISIARDVIDKLTVVEGHVRRNETV